MDEENKLIYEDGVMIIVPSEELEERNSREATDDEDGMLAGIESLIKSQTERLPDGENDAE